MRGYASFGVVVFHIFTLANLVTPTLFSSVILSWNSGVDFFFVLSGFLLSIPFVGGRPKNLKEYYLKRLFRIFPVYYLSLAVAAGLLFVYYHDVTAQQMVSSLFFAQSFFPSTFDSINGVSWTLVIEEIFYATLPVFSFFFLGGRWKISLPVCVAIAVAYRLILYGEYSHSGDLAFYLWQYPSYIGHFALGATLANFFVNKKARAGDRFRTPLPLLLSVVMVLGTQFWVGATYSAFHDKMALPGMLFAFEYTALLYASITSPVGSIFRTALTNRVASTLGKLSFSLYAWHLPIEELLLRLRLPTPEWAFVSVTVVLLVSAGSYLGVERPFLSLRTRLLRPRVPKVLSRAPTADSFHTSRSS